MEGNRCEAKIKELFEAIYGRYSSLEEFVEDANVPLSFLEALERRNWESLPEMVYVKAFLKKICVKLGLDAEEMIRAVSECVSDKEIKPEIVSIPVKRSTLRVGIGKFTFAFVLVLLLLSAFFVYKILRVGRVVGKAAKVTTNSSNSTAEATVRVSTAVNSTERVGDSHKEIEGKSETRKAEVVQLPKLVVISKDGVSWYRWSCPDINLKKQGFVNMGEKKEFSVNGTCRIKLGNPEVVVLEFGGKEYSYSGNKPLLLEVSPSGINVVRR